MRAGVLALGGLALLGCLPGTHTSPIDGNVGVSAGGAGGDGAGGGGGGDSDAAADAGNASPPGCLAALFAQCPTEGACTMASQNSGALRRACYPNGVQVNVTVSGACLNGDFHVSYEVRKPDGSACYTEEISANYLCEFINVAWTDSSSTEIASGHYGGGETRFLCARSGEVFLSDEHQPDWVTPGTGCEFAPCP